jgi:multidrug resistance protein, MATE family
METTSNPLDPREGLRELTHMAVPIILGTLSFTFMQFVDHVMVARIGTDALAAVGSAGIWSFTLATFFLGVVGCVATFVSQSLGRGERDNCARYTWQGIYISMFTGIAALLLWPFSETLFSLMGHEPAVVRLETTYFNIRLLGYVFIAWQAGLAAFFQAVNRPRIPMYVAFAANIANVVLDYLLIFGKFGFPEWGIGGAAAATVISLGLQVVLLQTVFLNDRYHGEFKTRTSWAFDLKKTRELFRIGWPSGTGFMLDVLMWAVFVSVIIGRFGGTAQLAANNAAMGFMQMCFMPAVGLSQAVTPIVGQWIGRGEIAVAKARTYLALRIAMVYMTVAGIVLAVAGGWLIRLFFSQDPEVVRLGHILLVMAAIFQAFDAVNIIAMGALRGAGDTRWMMWVLLIAGYGAFVPVAIILALVVPVAAVGAWLGATVYIIVLSRILYLRFDREGWRHIRIFDQDRAPV